MTSTFIDVTVQPRISPEDTEWARELQAVERAVAALLAAKRRTLKKSPVREQVLWTRYSERFRVVKRQLDAAVM